MSRTKGAKGKHNKEKPLKEKKKRGRPSKKQHQHQQQKQIVNVNVNSDGGGSSRKPQIPLQIPSTIYDPSLITPHYGINDRQPTNPLTDPSTDLMTPLLQAMIANQKQNQQQKIITQPIPQPIPQPTQPIPQPIPQPTQPIPQPIPQPIKQPEKPKIILPSKPSKPEFTHEDVQHLIDQIHQKQKKEIAEPIPQNTPKPLEKPVINDILGLSIEDKYDGLKMKNKTMPWSEVASGTAYGIAGGVAGGIAGGSLINNAILSAGSYIGYKVGGEAGAAIGGILSSSVADKMNPSYKPSTKKTESHKSGYEEIPSYSQQRVNGGTVTETRNIKQREPSSKQSKLLISRLGDALKDVAPSTRTPARQKIKESKLLKDLEQRQKTYGTIQPSDIEPQEPKQSTLTQIKEGARDLYRRLSGKKKGEYMQVPTTDDDDFKSTLVKSKQEGQTKGTYAILPQDEVDLEAELAAMNKRARTRKPRDEAINLMDQIVNEPNPPWPAMQQFKTQNEKNIRKSIARTDNAEREERIKQGLLTPQTKQPKPPRTPKQQLAINKLGELVSKSQEKQKEKQYMKTLQDAEPLIFKREIKRAKKVVKGIVDENSSKIAKLDSEKAVLEGRKAELKPFIENHEAIRIQTAMRNKIARDTLKKTRTSKNTAATTIQKTFRGKIGRNKIINDYEDQITKVEKNISDLRLNLNEQRPKGLRQGLKKLQDRKSEINTRGITEFNREQKKAENRILNSQIEHYENVIIKRKTGPNVKGIIDQFGGAAFTPKKK